MTYPEGYQQQYVQQQPPQGYPAPQQGYAPPQQAPQQPPVPGYPVQEQYQQPYPQQQPGFPVPQAQFQAPPPPPEAPPLPPVTMDDFMSQPGGGDGKSLSFEYPGTRYVGIVIRNITSADLERQTDPVKGTVARHSDDREKLVMKVPLLLTMPNPAYPDGIGVLYVNANLRNELARAQEAAGVPVGAPRAGDTIDITFTHEQQVRAGMSKKKVKRIVYTGGNGVPPEMPTAQSAQNPMGVQQFAQGGYVGPSGQQQYAQPQQSMQVPPPPSQYTQPLQPQQYPAPQMQMVQPQPMQVPGPQQPPAPQYAPPQPPQPQPGQYGQPQAPWNPYAQQPAPPTAPPAAQPAPPSPTATATGPASPSSPPPDWPADVQFRPGLSVEQARMAQQHNLPMPPTQ